MATQHAGEFGEGNADEAGSFGFAESIDQPAIAEDGSGVGRIAHGTGGIHGASERLGLMVVHKIDLPGVAAPKAEYDAPVGGDADGPSVGQGPDGVQTETGMAQVAGMLGHGQQSEDTPYPFEVSRRQATAIVPLPEPLQTAMPEGLDGHGLTLTWHPGPRTKIPSF